ncbi:uncharacterized protein DUF4265 [Sinobacterium caligoides]|uniref:Uncharacterized protein DUF4265 n=1 Tax=Sinobacterium caligoides TaxID=933926 RepID=A0A3N2DH02_9GAMM|nr:DUF4265 domain-containing protein [Sinobacterium caligoides]ROR99073.1 uncharacterized protein DUF4265 [Sinobacterium caligoides]
MKQHAIIELPAGQRTDGSTVMEKVAIRRLADGRVEMLHSPGFVKGAARGDTLKFTKEGFEVEERAGLVAIQIYLRDDIEKIEPKLSAEIKTMDGCRDICTERMLVYSVPVEAGFAAIEGVMKEVAEQYAQLQWFYGNVYDEQGEPMNWWMNEK